MMFVWVMSIRLDEERASSWEILPAVGAKVSPPFPKRNNRSRTDRYFRVQWA